jgi:hypothetical protein
MNTNKLTLKWRKNNRDNWQTEISSDIRLEQMEKNLYYVHEVSEYDVFYREFYDLRTAVEYARSMSYKSS